MMKRMNDVRFMNKELEGGVRRTAGQVGEQRRMGGSDGRGRLRVPCSCPGASPALYQPHDWRYDEPLAQAPPSLDAPPHSKLEIHTVGTV